MENYRVFGLQEDLLVLHMLNLKIPEMQEMQQKTWMVEQYLADELKQKFHTEGKEKDVVADLPDVADPPNVVADLPDVADLAVVVEDAVLAIVDLPNVVNVLTVVVEDAVLVETVTNQIIVADLKVLANLEVVAVAPIKNEVLADREVFGNLIT